MKNQIANYIKAAYSGIYIVSCEEQRVEREVMAAVQLLKDFKFYEWSLTMGIIHINGNESSSVADTQDPLAMLTAFHALPEKSILLARDLHCLLESNPMVIRKTKDVVLAARSCNRVLVIVGCRYVLPPELEKEFTKVELSLPSRDDLEALVKAASAQSGIGVNGSMEKIVDAACGLTSIEADNAMALAIIETKRIDPDVVYREKCNEIKKNGILEVVEQKVSLQDVGGLECLKEYLTEKRNLFSKAAREYGIKAPRGVLVVGQPGTGKSLTAMATASIFGLPLIRLEAGRLFSKYVGESEANWRSAFQTVKANAPCILWIDEVDGLVCGMRSSGESDGGTTARVIKAVLQDMQMNSEGIFYVLTANDIDGLPDPLIDRMDVFSVDLPNSDERQAIWKIKIVQAERATKKFNTSAFSVASDGFSGRQIEQAWFTAMARAFNDNGREPKDEDVFEVLKRFVSTSKTMAAQIEGRRQRLHNRAMPASMPIKAVEGRRLVTK